MDRKIRRDRPSRWEHILNRIDTRPFLDRASELTLVERLPSR